MAIVINGSGTITGLSAGGLPDGSVDSDTLATGIDATKLADGTVTSTELQYINTLSSNAQTQIDGAGGGLSLTTMTGVTTSGQSYYDISGIPSGVDKFYVVFQGVSTSGTADILVQLNDAQGLETSGYQSVSSGVSSTISSTTGFIWRINSGSDAGTGVMEFSHITSNLWVYTGVGMRYASYNAVSAGGKKSMSDVVDGLRFKTTSGTFDGGSIYVQYWS